MADTEQAAPYQVKTFASGPNTGKRAVYMHGRIFAMIRDGESADEAYERASRAREAKAAADAAARASEPPGELDEQTEAKLQGAPGAEHAGDPKPRGARKTPAGAAKISDAQLSEMIGELLSMPALAFSLPRFDPSWHWEPDPSSDRLDAGAIAPGPGIHPFCPYCAQHFAENSDPTAKALVKAAKPGTPLRKALERVYRVYGQGAGAAVIALFAIKPISHHLAPPQVRQLLGPFGLGATIDERAHAAAQAPYPGNARPPGTPAAGAPPQPPTGP